MMTGRDLVLSAIRREKTERIPWVPFVGAHGGSFLGQDAEAYFRSADIMVEAQKKAALHYKADGIPVTFDLQIEAEVLGCKLHWSAENPPSVAEHLPEELWRTCRRIPTTEEGRIPLVLDAARRLRAELPDVALYGLVTGPFTLAMHLAGSDLFMEMYDDEDSCLELIDYCRQVIDVLVDGYIDAGCDVIAIVDPMTSQIGPDQFEQFCSPAFVKMFDHIRARGKVGSFFVCGHAKKNIAVMADCKPDNISIDENIPLDFVRDECLSRNVSFGGNLRLTTVMLMGTPDANAAHAYETMEIGGDTGFILAPGCDMPYAVPPENVVAIAEVVQDPYKREAAKILLANRAEEKLPEVTLPDFANESQVIIDIITLDSEGCAPCQYMVEAVNVAAADFGERVVWREHKIKSLEGVAYMMALGVTNIPTIVIDGKIVFVSSIPPKEQIAAAIAEAIGAKQPLQV